MTDRRDLLIVLGAAMLAPRTLRAQASRKAFRIALVSAAPSTTVQARFEAFRQGVRELGYVEGKSIVIETRHADNDTGRLPALFAELVRLGVDVILTSGSSVTHAAKAATSTIPIVMAQDPDPVASGVIASLARPGGNVTGMSTIMPQIIGKQLELLKEVVPGLSRVAVISNAAQSYYAQTLKEAERAGAALKMQIGKLDLQKPSTVDSVLQAARDGRAQALLFVQSFVTLSERARIAEFSIRNRLPSMFPQTEYVEVGGLMAYGASIPDLYRRAATYVDKILKGAKPADLPVEQPTKFELVVNMKTAKAIGLTLPQPFLMRVDRVIE